MTTIETIQAFIKQKAEQFGAKTDTDFNKSYVERKNVGADALKDDGAYFGFIHPDEENSGPFHDFSLTIFPSSENMPWLLCLGIGSLGFKNDYELATFPGLRRLFVQLINERGNCKSDFSDIETGLPKNITANDGLQHLKNTIKKYTKVLPVCQIVDNPLSEEGQKIIAAFVAGYAKLRDWPTNNDHRNAISDALKFFIKDETDEDETAILNLLKERKYVVLQGPPGTGKTRTAKLIADNLKAKSFFTQFHAETTYSDFIYGIKPKLDSQNLAYKGNDGVFVQALKYAIEKGEPTLLIIDEINRANLSNVLGPIFYLFEYKQDVTNAEIEISPDLKLNKIPSNFFVIATMNTADRSLAVVDFALRRRFAWYALKPKSIKPKDGNFYPDDFSSFKNIFEWYANSNELILQPGQAYFIASSKDEMTNRIRYELYPLIKEYLQEGLLRSAKEEFNNYFMNRISKSLSE